MRDFLPHFEWAAKTIRDNIVKPFFRPVVTVAGGLLSTPVPFVVCNGCGSPYGPSVSTPCYVCQLQKKEAEEEVSEPGLSPCHCSSLGGECIWCTDAAEVDEPITLTAVTEDELITESLFPVDDDPIGFWCVQCRESYSEGERCSCFKSPAQPVAASGAVEGPRRGYPPSPSGVPTKSGELAEVADVTRVVLVHDDGHFTEKWAKSWKVSIQDDGRTLKLFPNRQTGPRYEHTPGFFDTPKAQ